MPAKKNKYIRKRYQAVDTQAQGQSPPHNLEFSDEPQDYDLFADDAQNDTFQVQALLLQQIEQFRQQQIEKQESQFYFPEDDIIQNDEALFTQIPKLSSPPFQQFFNNESVQIATKDLNLIQNTVQNSIVSLSKCEQSKPENIGQSEGNKTLAQKKKESLQNIRRQLLQLALKKEAEQRLAKEENQNLIDQLDQVSQLELNSNNVCNFMNQNIQNRKDNELVFFDEPEDSNNSDQTNFDLSIGDFNQIVQFMQENQQNFQIQSKYQQLQEDQMFLKEQIKQIIEGQRHQIQEILIQPIQQVKKSSAKKKQPSENDRRIFISKINSEYTKNLRESMLKQKTLDDKNIQKKGHKLNNQTDQSDKQEVKKQQSQKKISFYEIIGVKTFKFADEVNKISRCIQYHEGINDADKAPRRKNNKQNNQFISQPVQSQFALELAQKLKSSKNTKRQKVNQNSISFSIYSSKRQSKRMS